MKRFEFPPLFNPEDSSRRPINPKVERNADTTMLSEKKAKEMRIDELFGLLNPKEFEQLLNFDFRELLRDNPQIDGIFSPEEELERIKRLPREQKREALVTFKESLARQREGLAALRVFIERNIEFNHDVSRDRLMRLIEKFGAKYGFNERQRRISERLIDGYFENRQKVLAIRRQFPDDYELVRELTGINLDKNKEVYVSVGPMTIDIDVDAFNAGRLYQGSDNPVVGFIHSGFASESVGENPIYYIVINHDELAREIKFNDPVGDKTRRHEYEHQKNKLFRKVFEYQETPPVLSGYREEQDPIIKKVVLEDFFTVKRKEALENVKDEITALLYDRDLLALQKQLEQLFFSGEGPYDYLAYLRNWKEFENDPLYQKMVQQMLVWEYREIIQRAVDSYAELVLRGDYSTQKATALLTDKSLENWPKTIRRMLKQKGF